MNYRNFRPRLTIMIFITKHIRINIRVVKHNKAPLLRDCLSDDRRASRSCLNLYKNAYQIPTTTTPSKTPFSPL